MRIRLILSAAALLAASGSLAAQDESTVEPPADSMMFESPGMLLPAELVPPAPGRSDRAVLHHDPELVPVLFGIFGGIAGLFVADWWDDRNCGDSCGQMNIAALFLGGGLGAIIGWVVGGGEIPQPPPERWP